MNRKPDPSETNLIPAKVLVVEDDGANSFILSSLTKRLVEQADVSHSGAEMMGRLDDWDYDLVFMDVKMPRMDGYEATRRIREYEEKTGSKRTKIIAVTAYALEEDRTRCLESGMDDYMTKPILFEKLTELIYRHLEAPE